MSTTNRAPSTGPPLDSVARKFPLGPRLPQELLDLIVEHLAGDLDALCQCCLTSSALLAPAQCALFRDVKIQSGSDHKCNLERLRECYMSRDFARHARSLSIEDIDWSPEKIEDNPSFQTVISLLSTCKQNVADGLSSIPPTLPASHISSLSLSGLIISAAVFARVVYAFPLLTELSCDNLTVNPSSTTELNHAVQVGSASPPRLLSMGLWGSEGVWRLCSTLFPDSVDVSLRSVYFNDESGESAWRTIFPRAAHNLEGIMWCEWDSPNKVPLDLSANTRLRRVRLEFSRFKGAFLTGWAIPTLCSIRSDQLEKVTMGSCAPEDPVQDRIAFQKLDDALIRSKSLRWVNISYTPHKAPDAEHEAGIGELTMPEFFESAMPRCHAIGVLHIDRRRLF